jgi:pimeloyl-ACP methyl ester carboxylesterase
MNDVSLATNLHPFRRDSQFQASISVGRTGRPVRWGICVLVGFGIASFNLVSPQHNRAKAFEFDPAPLPAIENNAPLQAPEIQAPATQAPATGNKKKPDPLAFRLETITTKDGVPLACGYFPSDRGKKAVPVILLHEWKGMAPPYSPLAEALQKVGCAVVTPDLRGHGGSRNYTDARGQVKEFDLSRLNRGDVQAILARDIEAVKGFLKTENDAEKVNLNALTIIGFGEGGILAANYAAIDWNFTDIGNKKQSKDVRAIVAVSPERVLQGFNFDAGLKHPFVSRLPWLILAGESSSQAAEAEKMHKQLDRLRKAGSAVGPASLVLVKSQAENVRLVRETRDTIPKIVDFVKVQVVEQQDKFPWIKRTDE